MEKTTTKAFETKMITARELFSMSYATRELYSDEKIASMKKEAIEKAHANIEFFENEGIIFYIHKFKERGKELATINTLTDFTSLSGGELWKLGFVNRKTGQIILLFGGHFIARGRKEAFKYYEIAKLVTANKFENPADLVPFAQKD
jgi:predicted Holliday junction resolvase-like endonuclease